MRILTCYYIPFPLFFGVSCSARSLEVKLKKKEKQKENKFKFSCEDHRQRFGSALPGIGTTSECFSQPILQADTTLQPHRH